MRTSSVAVPLAEAKNELSELVDRVSRGEEFVITRHNAEIARLAERRKRSTVADSSHFLAILDALPIETDSDTITKASTTTLALARTYGPTLYDGAYLELAIRRSLPLATLDKDLRSAAKKTGVSCLPKDM